MKPGQIVVYPRAYRARGKPGGWTWVNHEATIITMKKKTAVVAFQTKYGNVMRERTQIRRLRLRPVDEIKVTVKATNIELEISGE